MTAPASAPVPAVSVIIPAFNRAGSVAGAVASVTGQDFTDIEVILVDDASTDGTLAVLEALVAADPRLRLLRHDRNQGAAAARNSGIAAARGALIAFQDSDDLWLPEKLRLQVAALAADPAAVAAYCAMAVENPEAVGGQAGQVVPDPAQHPRAGNLHSALLRGSFISTQTLVVRRAALDRIGGFDPAMPALEDWDFALRLAALGPIAMVDRPLVRQRYSGNSLTLSLEKRLAGFRAILARHEAALAAAPGLLGLHHARIAGTCRRLGDLDGARHHARSALRFAPLSPRRIAMALWLSLPQRFLRRAGP